MALTALTSLNSATSTAGVTSLATPSISPSANALLVVVVGTRTGSETASTVSSISSTLSGLGTWTVIEEISHAGSGGTAATLSVWRCQCGGTPGSGTITANLSGTSNRTAIIALECTGHNQSTPIAQSAEIATAGTSLTVTLGSTPTASSNMVGAVLNRAATTAATEDGEHTQRAAVTPGSSNSIDVEVCDDLGSADTTVQWTTLTNAAAGNNLGIAFEVAEAGGGNVTVNANAGTLTLAGQSATVQAGEVSVAASAGTATLTGQSASVVVGEVSVATNAGTLTIEGQAAEVQATVDIAIQTGALTLAGQAASVQPGAVTIACNAGTLTLAGQQAAIIGDVEPITVAVTRVACNTSTGTQDITTSDLNGLTPKAAWLIVTYATADATAADHAMLGVGAVTGSSARWAAAMADENGVSTTDTFVSASATTCVRIINPTDGSVNGEADFSAWIANGITINWTDAPSAAFLLTVVFFAGDDLQAVAGNVGVGDTTDNVIDVNTVGFRPQAVLTAMPSDVAQMSLGLVHENGSGTVTQRGVTSKSRDDVADSANNAMIRTDGAVIEVLTGGLIDWYGEFGSFDSSGFSITTRNAGGNSRTVYYLALNFGSSVDSWVGTLSTPTSTGNLSITAPGFQPQFAIMIPSLLESAGAQVTDSKAWSWGMSVIDGDEQYSNIVTSEDAAGFSNTQSLSSNVAAAVPAHNGTLDIEATFSGFNGSGGTLNFSNVHANAKLWPALFIEYVPGEAQTVNAGAGSLSLAGQQATVAIGELINVAAGALALAGQQATVSAGTSPYLLYDTFEGSGLLSAHNPAPVWYWDNWQVTGTWTLSGGTVTQSVTPGSGAGWAGYIAYIQAASNEPLALVTFTTPSSGDYVSGVIARMFNTSYLVGRVNSTNNRLEVVSGSGGSETVEAWVSFTPSPSTEYTVELICEDDQVFARCGATETTPVTIALNRWKTRVGLYELATFGGGHSAFSAIGVQHAPGAGALATRIAHMPADADIPDEWDGDTDNTGNASESWNSTLSRFEATITADGAGADDGVRFDFHCDDDGQTPTKKHIDAKKNMPDEMLARWYVRLPLRERVAGHWLIWQAKQRVTAMNTSPMLSLNLGWDDDLGVMVTEVNNNIDTDGTFNNGMPDLSTENFVFPADQWNEVAIYYKWHATDGRFAVWLNGELIYDFDHIRTMISAPPEDLNPAHYERSSGPANYAYHLSPNATTMWLDNYAVSVPETFGDMLPSEYPGTSISINTGTLSLAGQTATVQPGAISVSMQSGALTLTGETASAISGTIVSVNAGTLAFVGQQASVVPGAAAVQVAEGTLALTGQPATIDSAVTIDVQAGTSILSGQQASADVGIMVTVATAMLSVAGQSATIQPGAATVVMAIATLSIVGQQALFYEGELVVATIAATVYGPNSNAVMYGPNPDST